MKKLIQFVSICALLAAVLGCSAESSEKVAAAARVEAAAARVNAADANARVKAADAHVKAADARVEAADAGVEASKADARVKTTTNPAAKAAELQQRLTIPSGTVLTVLLIDGLSTDTSSGGDRFLASLAEPVVVDGGTVLQKGTKVRGLVIDVEGSDRVKGRASIRLGLTDIIQGNRLIQITTDSFTATAESSTARDAAIIAGGAGVGAAIGAIAGGKKGAAIGSVAGGGAGTGAVLATKGKEIHYAPETRLSFTLVNSVRM
jgi:hypothetical protein